MKSFHNQRESGGYIYDLDLKAYTVSCIDCSPVCVYTKGLKLGFSIVIFQHIYKSIVLVDLICYSVYTLVQV